MYQIFQSLLKVVTVYLRSQQLEIMRLYMVISYPEIYIGKSAIFLFLVFHLSQMTPNPAKMGEHVMWLQLIQSR